MFTLDGSKVLVTGGAGHIGSHIVDAVLAEGASRVLVLDNFAEGNSRNLQPALRSGRVEVLARDIRDYEDLEVAMKGVDFVFHTASIMLLEARMRPAKAMETNINGTFNVLRAAARSDVRKVVFSSTGSVYGEPLYLPMDENHPYNNETIYGATKIAGEQFCRNVHREHGLAFVALRYFNVYGPRMDIYGAYTEVLIRWMERIAAGKAPLILGDGTQTMDFIYIEDIARANILAAKSPVTDEVLNIASGVESSLNELAESLMRVMWSELKPEYGPARRVNAVPRRLAETTRAQRMIGFQSRVSLEDGLRRLVAWWRWANQPSPETARAWKFAESPL
jgi:UDP-glucose 4-epimerase